MNKTTPQNALAMLTYATGAYIIGYGLVWLAKYFHIDFHLNEDLLFRIGLALCAASVVLHLCRISFFLLQKIARRLTEEINSTAIFFVRKLKELVIYYYRLWKERRRLTLAQIIYEIAVTSVQLILWIVRFVWWGFTNRLTVSVFLVAIIGYDVFGRLYYTYYIIALVFILWAVYLRRFGRSSLFFGFLAIVFIASLPFSRSTQREILTDKLSMWAFLCLLITVLQEYINLARQKLHDYRT